MSEPGTRRVADGRAPRGASAPGRPWRRRVALAAVGFAVAAAALAWQLTTPRVPSFAQVERAYRPSEAVLLDRHGEVLDVERRDYAVRRLAWVPLADVSPALVAAVVDGEDRRFHRHGGVDLLAVAGAARDRALDRNRRGASTITMQLATLLGHARGGRGLDGSAWRRKVAQARFAFALERTWSKDEILEAYLNLVQFRGELQGIGAASALLAGKAPAGLTRAEGHVLAALLPRPGSGADAVAARACARAADEVPCDELAATARALLDRDAARPAADPALAPHLARRLLTAPGASVATTLDAGAQRLATDVLRRHLAGLADRNVRDGAALVVDVASGDVLAYVGSAGPASRAPQVDGVRAARQAGSTLKPFLYELALERRYLTAASLLDDSPVNLDTATGAYIPQNYDRTSRGPVSVRTSLGSSLNVPAVRTLVLVGVEPFRERLHALGYDGLTESGEFYGYSLALGSADVSLWQQAAAYRALARGGTAGPLRLRPTDPATSERAVAAPAASFVIGDVLADRAARVATFGLDNHLDTAYWSAAKTGTSKDMRDNWCIGWSSRYVVAVWVGNFEGDSMHDVTGMSGAAPAWREIMDALHEGAESRPPSPPAGVVAAQVAYARDVETPRTDWFLAGTEPAAAKIVPAAGAGAIARLASPANGLVIALDPDIPARLQKVALAAERADARLRLRLNDVAVGSAARPVLWTPVAGTHVLALEDAAGRTLDRVLFTVR